MYKLYYSPGACSLAVHVLLNETGAAFNAERVQTQGTKSPSLLAANPLGAVPVLEVDGQPITEGGAILTYLADTENSPLLPKSGLERAKALEALMFCNATLHPAYSNLFGLMKKNQLESDAAKAIAERIQTLWAHIETKLESHPYLAGNEPTVGDILLSVIAGWNNYFPSFNLTPGTKTQALIKTITSRPAYQKAQATEKAASDKAAA